MILESAMLQVTQGDTDSFEQDFKVASAYISSIPGYIDHELHKCLENETDYLLLVRWETLEAHTEGFRQSDAYLEWKQLLHHYYNPFPKVKHFTRIKIDA
ncbi:antibiotic biosynthesis monooxygenase [Listeria booriae]|uniref:antibiotic biosynthesis monooxygenase family protein n=1 Tax=Listeria booriae TaxID=1552123 RepID=UPI00162A46C6|nr:antibiotic biosynthesis monooxygenase [Listeria booriae]MBC1513978.1 antibiotic biosynthesis monooxygenase [Listeria booriae]MBC6129118.1 antibiotic biosynthesis monooxygenase [Listeria booriae]MBC6153075.1 antibiotic biosynthesis monooxygenase [Listeria booriae]MBC6307394.1 antibiotic biosynthesis monooxygenase [Listeria booriae]